MKGYVTVIITLTFGLAFATDSEWPVYGGPNHDGQITVQDGSFAETTGLKMGWRRTIGPSYSRVVVSQGMAVTAFSDGLSDYLVALDAKTGDQKWRYRIARTYKGHDGSTDGPLGTPLIHRGAVYGYGPWGHLYAVTLETGEALWQRDAVAAYGAVKPRYGFTSSPIAFEDLIIVQVGAADGRAVCAFDAKSGDLKWSHGDDSIGYASPVLTKLGDTTHLVAVTDTHIKGLDPKTGDLMWSEVYRSSSRATSGPVVPIDHERLLVFGDNEFNMYQIKLDENDKYSVTKLWTTTQLRGIYCAPVHHEGYLYGMTGRILTCINAKDGSRVWKSRAPGAGQLIMVNGHLVIWAPEGRLHIAKASPEGYQEVAAIQALDAESITTPSFADGRIYVRNLQEIAAVEVVADAGAQVVVNRDGVPDLTRNSAFGKFLATLEGADDQSARIDAFLAEQKSFPIIEDDLVHFVFRAEPDADVTIRAGHLRAYGEAMQEAFGSGLFYLTSKIDDDARITYAFAQPGQRPAADPLNQGEDPRQSVLRMPKWKPADFVTQVTERLGDEEKISIKSVYLEESREVIVHRPYAYADEEEDTFPLLIFVGEMGQREGGKLDEVIDTLIAKQKTEPFITVYVPYGANRLLQEATGELRDAFADFLAKELVPELEKRYQLRRNAKDRVLLGDDFGGFSSLYAGLRHPKTFGHVAFISLFTYQPTTDILKPAIEKLDGPAQTYHVLYHRYDRNDIIRAMYTERESKALADMLAKRPNVTVRTHAFKGSRSVGTWRHELDKVLAMLK